MATAKYLLDNSSLADSYDASNQSSSLGLGSTFTSVGQSFTGDGKSLNLITLQILKINNPASANITVKVYAHTGVYGTSSTFTGSPLATSDPIDIRSIPGSTLSLINFSFSGANKINLANGTNYVLDLAYSAASNHMSVGRDTTTPTHGGNANTDSTPVAGSDLIFYVYTDTVTTDSYLLEDGSGYYSMESGVTTTPNTADANAFATATPTLEFTGTQDDADDVRYNVQISSTSTPPDAITEYLSTGSGTDTTWPLSNVSTAVSQSFQGASIAVHMARFDLVRLGSPTGTLVSKIYAHFGVYGSSSVPTGAALATSNTVSVNDVSTSRASVAFTFPTPYTPVTGTNYTLTVELVGTADNSNKISVYIRSGASSSGHSGNFAEYAGFWDGNYPNDDVIFSLHSNATDLYPISNNSVGFLNTVTGGDTDPFNSGEKVSYTVQSALANGTYYWRARGIDPSGSNTYGEWSTTRSFTVTTGGGGSTGKIKYYNGSAFVAKSVKYWNGSAWVTKPLKRYNGTTWTITPY